MPAIPLDPAPVAHGTVLFTDPRGQLFVTVLVKATFALRPDDLAVPAPPLPLGDDTYGDASRESSLLAPSDLAPCKLRADILVVGRVHPRSAGVVRQVVGFALARGPDVLIRKRLIAVGDRRLGAAPAPLTDLPLCWERTWGGPGSADNPVGCGRSSDSRAPNLIDPDAPGRPAGLGPIAPSWPGRAALVAPEHAPGLRARPILLSDGLDLQFFQVAPPDQQIARLRGGEQILLVGLHRDHPSMVCRLPALHAFARLEGPRTRARGVPLAGDTLWIDAERGVACVTYRGSVKVGAGAEAQRLLEAREPWIVHAGMAPCEDVEEVLGAPRAWSLPHPGAPERPESPTVDPLEIVDESGFTIGSFDWSFEPPKMRRVLVVKGTFTLSPRGEPAISPEQEPLRSDEPAPVEPGAELVHPSDHVPFKARVDVLLRGTAHAPPGRTTALVGLTLGAVSARLVAIGPRTWDRAGIPSAPGPFAPVPLRYQHAFGGPGFAPNPAGTGLAPGTPPPLLEDPDRLIRSRGDRPAPACFGPISPAWPARSKLLGAFDRAWQKDRWPYFPADFDPAFFQAAPADRTCAELRGDEAFLLESVRPGGASFEGTLPAVRPRAFAVRRGGDPFEVLLRLDTVLFDTDAERVMLTWRGSIELESAIDRVVVLRESQSAPRSSEDVAAYLTTLGERRLAPGPGATRAAQEEARDAVRAGPDLLGRIALGGVPAGVVAGAAAGVFAARAARAVPAPAQLPPPLTRAQVEALVRDGKSLRGRDLSGADLRGIDLSRQDLAGAILARAKLGGARLDGASLAGANLAGADAAGASFEGADLSRADLTEAGLARARLARARLEGASLAGADLSEAGLGEIAAEGADFSRATLAGCNADGARLAKADLSGASLAGASLLRAQLDDAKLYEASAAGARFDGASLKDARFEKANLAGASFRDAVCAGTVWECADLSAAVLQGADAAGAIFSGAKLHGAQLAGLAARGATFRGADLTRAVLDGADLMQASFEKACLREALLRGANLYQAELHLANVEGADLSRALLAGTKLAG